MITLTQLIIFVILSVIAGFCLGIFITSIIYEKQDKEDEEKNRSQQGKSSKVEKLDEMPDYETAMKGSADAPVRYTDNLDIVPEDTK